MLDDLFATGERITELTRIRISYRHVSDVPYQLVTAVLALLTWYLLIAFTHDRNSKVESCLVQLEQTVKEELRVLIMLPSRIRKITAKKAMPVIFCSCSLSKEIVLSFVFSE